MTLKAGLKGWAETTVSRENTALAMGSGSLEVFATPAMVALMENAAIRAIELEAGQTSVGTLIHVSHTAATPLLMKVRAEAELVEADGRRLAFKVSAYDESGLIGSGSHERVIVDTEKFRRKTNRKSEPSGE
ncbi:MAG: thioesterase family protein [Peptococcaceae bacterium]|jgi:predicted thioesterase|nr:thioesterase family protein [Peptococcaceae bacterium]